MKKSIILSILVSVCLGLNVLASEQMEDINEKTYWLFVGNPGVGKSTLINALKGEIVAQADVSSGGGLTKRCTFYKDSIKNIYYCDTPGLQDIKENRERAAEEIEKALKQNGLYKIIFVLTLQAGRVKPEDVTTINTIMKAIDIPERTYSIIINKLTLKEKKLFREIKNNALIYAQLNNGESKTTSIYYIDNNSALDREEITILPLLRDFYTFMDLAPSIYIYEDQVTKITVEDLDTVIEMCQIEIEALKEEFEKDQTKQTEYIENLKAVLENQARQWFQQQIQNLRETVSTPLYDDNGLLIGMKNLEGLVELLNSLREGCSMQEDQTETVKIEVKHLEEIINLLEKEIETLKKILGEQTLLKLNLAAADKTIKNLEEKFIRHSKNGCFLL